MEYYDVGISIVLSGKNIRAKFVFELKRPGMEVKPMLLQDILALRIVDLFQMELHDEHPGFFKYLRVLLQDRLFRPRDIHIKNVYKRGLNPFFKINDRHAPGSQPFSCDHTHPVEPGRIIKSHRSGAPPVHRPLYQCNVLLETVDNDMILQSFKVCRAASTQRNRGSDFHFFRDKCSAKRRNKPLLAGRDRFK